MGKKIDNIMGTQPVRIDTGVLEIPRKVKEKIGIPIQRFIEDAIVEKADRLTDADKGKCGFAKSKK